MSETVTSMEPVDNPSPQQRDVCLPWMLGIFFIGFFVLMLTVATGGYFAYVLGLVAVIAVVAGMHYTLWGQGLGQTVARESEEEELSEDFPDQKWKNDTDERFRRPPSDT